MAGGTGTSRDKAQGRPGEIMTGGMYRPDEITPSGVRKVLRLLGSLRTTPAGSVLYHQVENMLDDIASSHLKAEITYAHLVNVLLDAYCAQLTPGSSQHLQLKLLQARLQPPLTQKELETLSEGVLQNADRAREGGALDPALLADAISPLLNAFGIEEPSQPAAAASRAGGTNPGPSISQAIPEEAEAESAVLPEAAEDAPAEAAPETGPAAGNGHEAGNIHPISGAPAAESTGDQAALIQGENINKLQDTLKQQVLDVISQNEEFGVILEVVLAELRQTEDVSEIENLRWTLIREIEKLMKLLQYPPVDDESEDAMKDSCGTLCNIIAGRFKSEIVSAGYIELEMSHFRNFRNSSFEGISFPDLKENKALGCFPVAIVNLP